VGAPSTVSLALTRPTDQRERRSIGDLRNPCPGTTADDATPNHPTNDVVDMTTFIVGDMAVVYEPFQKVRLELMSPDLPSSASVGVAALVDPHLHYEIKLIAAVAATSD
jgi:hypothetical protein